MEMPKNYDETVGVTGEFESLEAGGYICKIISAKEEESKNGNKMLVVAFDIAQGEHENYFQKRFDENRKSNTDVAKIIKWPNNGIHRLMVLDNTGNCNKFFKGFITAVENSNNNYNFKKAKFDEKTLKDKLFGGIFGEEEYQANDGSIKKITKLRWIRTVETIEDGKFEIPELKKLPQNSNSILGEFQVTDNSDDDLPF